MIVGHHPILTALNEAPFTFHLIGSRFVGKFTEASDYDFLGVAKDYDEWRKLREWLEGHGFKIQGEDGYGPDRYLYGTHVWTWSHKDHPGVDVLPVNNAEADLRLRWLRSMKKVGDQTGLIAKGLKAEKAWPLLWDTLRELGKGASNGTR